MPINLFNGEGNNDLPGDKLGGGRFFAGMQDENGNPMSLEAFRVVTDDPDAADRIVELFGGELEEIDAGDDGVKFQILTEADTVNVTIAPGGISTSLILWGANNEKIVETDGTHVIEDGVVTDQLCAYTDGKSLDDIFAMKFKANLRLFFTLTDAPDLGSFVFYSQSKTALAHWAGKENELNEIDATVSTTFTLEAATSRRGDYRKPQIGEMAHAEAEPVADTKSTPTKKTVAKKAPAKKVAKKATRKKVSK